MKRKLSGAKGISRAAQKRVKVFTIDTVQKSPFFRQGLISGFVHVYSVDIFDIFKISVSDHSSVLLCLMQYLAVTRQKFTCRCNFECQSNIQRKIFFNYFESLHRRAITFSQKDFIIGQPQKRCVSFSCSSLQQQHWWVFLYLYLNRSQNAICW